MTESTEVDTTDRTVLHGRDREKSIRLIAAVKELGVDVAEIRTVREGYDVPKAVAKAYEDDFADADTDELRDRDQSFEPVETNGEAWTEPSYHPEEAPEGTNLGEQMRIDAAESQNRDPAHISVTTKTKLAEGEQKNANRAKAVQEKREKLEAEAADAKAKADADAAAAREQAEADAKAAEEKAIADKAAADEKAAAAIKADAERKAAADAKALAKKEAADKAAADKLAADEKAKAEADSSTAGSDSK